MNALFLFLEVCFVVFTIKGFSTSATSQHPDNSLSRESLASLEHSTNRLEVVIKPSKWSPIEPLGFFSDKTSRLLLWRIQTGKTKSVAYYSPNIFFKVGEQFVGICESRKGNTPPVVLLDVSGNSTNASPSAVRRTHIINNPKEVEKILYELNVLQSEFSKTNALNN